MVASALDGAFAGADIEHVFGHLLQDIGLAVVFIHHFSRASDRSKEGNEVDGQNFFLDAIEFYECKNVTGTD
jgi:hypothetical protein